MSDTNHFQWRGGFDEECAFLKYGMSDEFLISIVRCWDTPSIEIAIRMNRSDLRAAHLAVPGYAPFSIEAGVGDSCVAIDGVGMLEQHPDEIILFRAGNMDFDDPYALFVLRRWLAVAKPPITICIGQFSLSVPFDATIFNAFGNLIAKQKYFQSLIVENPFYVRDGG
ncbi:MAG: hypothetical protein LBV44_05305 [Methylobacillus sp.]|jgi:hypothetical protein|nr:hypothetical protein [Methylobacillus sp.]